MFVVKLIHRDGSVVCECGQQFVWDSDHPAVFKYKDYDDVDTVADPAIVKVFIFFAGSVIFTRDLTTGQPVEYYNV